MNPYNSGKSKKPFIAGVLMIIAFILAVVAAGQIFFLDIDALNLEELEGQEELGVDFVKTIMNVCGAIFLIVGIFLLVGGILAIKRIYWGISLAASIAGIFSMGPFFLGSILSLIALVLIFMSKNEFNGKGEVQPSQFQQQPEKTFERQFEQEEKFCPECGTKMQYGEYQRWYCPHCQEYK
ncbi:MAG: hypothetical protein ACQEQM_05855 [Thermoplasmatota archaeon]